MRARSREIVIVGIAVVAIGQFAACSGSVTVATSTSRPAVSPSSGASPSRFAWERISTTGAPSIRVSAPMVFDPATGQVVLVGGLRIVQPTLASNATIVKVLDDTWVFAGDAWRLLHPALSPPSGSFSDVIAYDPLRSEPILVTAPALQTGTSRVVRSSTTWSWTGSGWQELLSSGPVWGSQRGNLAFDAATGQLVFTAATGGNTWWLGPSAWIRGPRTPGSFLQMAYDPVSRRLIGGSSFMWWWDGKAWHEFPEPLNMSGVLAGVTGAPTDDASPVTDWAANEIITLGWYPGSPARTFVWLDDGWRPIETRLNPAPNNPNHFSLTYDNAMRAVIAFGGDQGVRTMAGAFVYGGNQTWVLM